MPNIRTSGFINLDNTSLRKRRLNLRASLIPAVALTILVPAGNASAENDCGPLAGGTATCTDRLYADGIFYPAGGTVILDNPEMRVDYPGVEVGLGGDPEVLGIISNSVVAESYRSLYKINAIAYAGTANVVANPGKIGTILAGTSGGGDATIIANNVQLDAATGTLEAQTFMYGDTVIEMYGGSGKGIQALATLGFTYVTIEGGTLSGSRVIMATANPPSGLSYNLETHVTLDNGPTGLNISGSTYMEGDLIFATIGDITVDDDADDAFDVDNELFLFKPRLSMDADFNGTDISLSHDNVAAIRVLNKSMLSENELSLTLTDTAVTVEGNDSIGLSFDNEASSGAEMSTIMTGGALRVVGDRGIGVNADSPTQTRYELDFTLEDGRIETIGAGSHAFQAMLANNSSFNLNLNGGTVSSVGGDTIVVGNLSGASLTSVNIDIASGATLKATGGRNAFTSTITDPSIALAVTTAGTVDGHFMLGTGSSGFTILGGTVTGNIYGDYDQLNGAPTDTVNQGNDVLIWNDGNFNGTFYGQGGNDTVTIALPNTPAAETALLSASFDGGTGGNDAITVTTSTTSDDRADVLDFTPNSIINFESIEVDSVLLNIITKGGDAISTENQDGYLLLLSGAILISVNDESNILSSFINSDVYLISSGGTISTTIYLNNTGTKSQRIIINGDVFSSGGSLSTMQVNSAFGVGYSTLGIGNSITINGKLDGGIFFRFSFPAGNPIMADNLTINGPISGSSHLLPVVVGSGEVRPYKYSIVYVNSPTAANPAAFTSPIITIGAYRYVTEYFPDGYFQNVGGIAQKFGPSFALVPETDGTSTAFERPEFAETATINELIDAGIVLQPYVPLYEAYQSVLLEMTRLPSMKTRSGGRYDNGEALTSGPALDAMWGRVGGDYDHFDPQSSTASYDYDMSVFEMQAGLDGLFLDNANGALVAGFTAHYRTGEAKIASRYGDSKIHPDGYGFGGTLTWFGANGFYTDAQAALTWYTSELKADDLPLSPKDSDGFGYALSIEAGQAFAIGTGLALTPQAQLSFADVSIDGFTGAYSDDVSFSDGQSLLARAGLALEKESAWQDVNGQARAANVYGIANLYYEFLGETKARVVNLYDFTTDPDDFTGEIGFGGSIDWQAGKLQYSAFAELSASTGFNTGSYGYGGNIGLKIRW